MKYITLGNLGRFLTDVKTWAGSHFISKSDEDNFLTETDLGNVDASLYDVYATYKVNDYVIHDKKLYRCTTAISVAEVWNASHWTLAKATDIFQGSAPGLVPMAESEDADKVLKGDGTWGEAASQVRISYDAQAEELHMDFSPPLPPPSLVTIGGRDYPFVKIGNQLWLAENLDYKFQYSGSTLPLNPNSNPYSAAAWYYNRNEATYGIDGTYKCGLLYNWYAAKYLNDNKDTLLPEGWHVPSESEWWTLFSSIGGRENSAPKLKALDSSVTSNWPSGWNGTNDYGFNALPTGYYYESAFTELRTATAFWNTYEYSRTEAGNVFLSNSESSPLVVYYPMTIGFPLRLVKTVT